MIPSGLTPGAIHDAASRIDAGEAHPFGEPTTYEAIVATGRYAPKALLGVAAKHHLGVMLLPTDFRGGERPGEANWYLRRLGFDVVSKDVKTGDEWTDDEVWVAIEMYFELLRRSLNSESFVKAEYMRALARRTHGRSVNSARRKMENVSAVLVELGLTYLDGYAPMYNFQTRLAELVDEYLDTVPETHRLVSAALDDLPRRGKADVPLRESIEEQPPEHEREPRARQFKSRKVIDRAGCDAANRALGRAGEEFVVELERKALHRAGKSELADRVRWVADLDGDGAGHDVRSFDESGEELYIEVKTTNGPKETPFYVTANELAFADVHPDRYRLYRLFNFARAPRLYVLVGSLTAAAELEPVTYRARVKSRTEETPR